MHARAGGGVAAASSPGPVAGNGHPRGWGDEAAVRPSAARVFLIAFLVCFAASAIWSYATPLFAAPDEPSHIVKAAAVVRGELVGNQARGKTNVSVLVRAPAFFSLLRWPAADPAHSLICFHAKPTVSAACAQSPNARATAAEVAIGATREAWIYTARYPPLYYAVVGIPTLFGQRSWVLYLMRLVSAALTAVFLALGFTATAWSRNRFLLAGLLVATTPMVLFLGGVVNPSGLEISAAISTWCSGSVLFFERRHDPPLALVVVFAVSACVFELVRSLSPFWLLLSLLALAALAGRRGVVELASKRPLRIVAGTVAVFAVIAVLWTLGEHATAVYSTTSLRPGTPVLTILETSFQHNAEYVPDMVGVFGWFDTDAPSFTYVAWYALAGLVVVLALAAGALRTRLVLLGMVGGVLLVPVAISSSQALAHGYVWSGRDTLPFAVGLPIVAAAIAGPELGRLAPRLVRVVAVTALLAQFAAFYEALRRYAVGTLGPDFSFVTHAPWQPTVLGCLGALVVEALALGCFYGFAVFLSLGPPAHADGRDGPPRGRHSATVAEPSMARR